MWYSHSDSTKLIRKNSNFGAVPNQRVFGQVSHVVTETESPLETRVHQSFNPLQHQRLVLLDKGKVCVVEVVAQDPGPRVPNRAAGQTTPNNN